MGTPGGAARPLPPDAIKDAAKESPLDLGSLRAALIPGSSSSNAIGSNIQPSIGASAPAAMAEDVPEEVGASGELFVYELFARSLPDFVRACWVSKFKLSHIPDASPASIENDLGADFRYVDRAGQLSGSGVSETVYIEVKSMTSDHVAPFRLSINEWNLATKCHASGGRDVYIIVVVTSVTRKPKLAELIIDPVSKVASGAATCEVLEMVFTPTAFSSSAGAAVSEAAAAEVATTGNGKPVPAPAPAPVVPVQAGRGARGGRGGRTGAKGGAGGGEAHSFSLIT